MITRAPEIQALHHPIVARRVRPTVQGSRTDTPAHDT
jgi:hypothetical protein